MDKTSRYPHVRHMLRVEKRSLSLRSMASRRREKSLHRCLEQLLLKKEWLQEQLFEKHKDKDKISSKQQDGFLAGSGRDSHAEGGLLDEEERGGERLYTQRSANDTQRLVKIRFQESSLRQRKLYVELVQVSAIF
ncbi:unnamed protein product [Merluccius merluccius]